MKIKKNKISKLKIANQREEFDELNVLCDEDAYGNILASYNKEQ